MDWTINFIEEYRNSPVLWDIRLAEYKNNRAKLDAFNKLSMKVDCDPARAKKN